MRTPRTTSSRLCLLGATAALVSGSAIAGPGNDAAAAATGPACAGLTFYWEIGNAEGVIASGAQTTANATAPIDPDAPMPLASASKWLWAAAATQYMAQRGGLTAGDIRLLSMRGGYTHGYCAAGGTVDGCYRQVEKTARRNAASDSFYYGAGSMLAEAATGLDGIVKHDDANALSLSVRSLLGMDVLPSLSYLQPNPGQSGIATPRDYGGFLRKVLQRRLAIADQLGGYDTCTSTRHPEYCEPGEHASFSPRLPRNASNLQAQIWRYGVGFWVEKERRDSTGLRDGAYSSPGDFGFYPWITADRQLYGLVARVEYTGRAYIDSVRCGQAIRAAFSGYSPL